MSSSVTTFKTTPANIDQAADYLGKRLNRPIANHTELIKHTGSSPAHVLHHGYIIATYEDGPHTHSMAWNRRPIVRLRTAGYNSASTARRLDTLLQAALAPLTPPDTYGTRYAIKVRRGQIVLQLQAAPDSPLTQSAEYIIGTSSVGIYADGTTRLEVDPIPDYYGQTQLHPDHRTE